MFNKYSTDYGLLIIRAGMGILFLIFGWPKIIGGTEMWNGIGGSMANVGIHFAPTFWGFMAAFAEFAGGIDCQAANQQAPRATHHPVDRWRTRCGAVRLPAPRLCPEKAPAAAWRAG